MGHIWTGACGIFHQIKGPVTFRPELKKIHSSSSKFWFPFCSAVVLL